MGRYHNFVRLFSFPFSILQRDGCSSFNLSISRSCFFQAHMSFISSQANVLNKSAIHKSCSIVFRPRKSISLPCLGSVDSLNIGFRHYKTSATAFAKSPIINPGTRSRLNSNLNQDLPPLKHNSEVQVLQLASRKLSNKMSADDVLQGLDETQVRLMQEECILVNENDKKIGSASKKVCHLLENINKGMLHRAFSVFLFNTKGELLLQQRAEAKITFPDHFTNTCCSHPLNFEAELDENEAIGVKKAAQRKLKHELGIEPEQIPLEDFHYLTRILYKAENIPKDNKWGEYEIDYILFIQKDVTVVPNTNEVKSHRYVSQEELKKLMNSATDDELLITPWFKLIVQRFLYKWWNSLGDIQTQADRKTIHNMLKV